MTINVVISLITLLMLLLGLVYIDTAITDQRQVDYNRIAGIVAANQCDLSLDANDLQLISDSIEIPQVKVDDSKVRDIWDSIHAASIAELEDHAYNDTINELEDRDYRDLEGWLENNIFGFDEIEDVDEDQDETEITIIELGIDEEDDKIAQVSLELEVEYTLSEGESTTYKKTIFVTGNVVYDEGDFSDEEVRLTYRI